MISKLGDFSVFEHMNKIGVSRHLAALCLVTFPWITIWPVYRLLQWALSNSGSTWFLWCSSTILFAGLLWLTGFIWEGGKRRSTIIFDYLAGGVMVSVAACVHETNEIIGLLRAEKIVVSWIILLSGIWLVLRQETKGVRQVDSKDNG